MKKKILGYGIAILSLAGVLFVGLLLRAKRIQHNSEIAPPERHPWALRTDRVIAAPAQKAFPCLATLSSSAEITISGQLQGRILEMGPREGVAVKRGEVLALIDSQEIDAQIARAKAQQEAAQAKAAHQKKEAAREADLLAAGGSTASRVEELQSIAKAQAAEVVALGRQVRALEVRRAYASIKAPQNGIVAARLAEVGDLCMPTHPIYRLTVSKGARISLRLPQSILEQVQPGTSVELVHGKARQRITLTRIHPALDTRALGIAEADVETWPFGLPSGARISARVILAENAHALLVPQTAVLARAGHFVLFRVVSSGIGTAAQAQLEEVAIEVGLAARGKVAVKSTPDFAGKPLRAGQRIVSASAELLSQVHDGDRIVSDKAAD